MRSRKDSSCSINIIEAKPTTYKSVEFRSKSEARMAVALDLADYKWEYEPFNNIDFETKELLGFPRWSPDFLLKKVILRNYEAQFLMEYKPKKPNDEYLDWWDSECDNILNKCKSVRACIILWADWYYGFTNIQYKIITRNDGDGLCAYMITNQTIKSSMLYEKMKEAGHYRFDLD